MNIRLARVLRLRQEANDIMEVRKKSLADSVGRGMRQKIKSVRIPMLRLLVFPLFCSSIPHLCFLEAYKANQK